MSLNWVLIVWCAAASASFTLGAIHFLVWFKSRTAWANLLFSLTALGIVATACCELWMMRAETPAEIGTALRWLQVAVWVDYVSVTGFALLYLRAGRLWLALTMCAVRTCSLGLNFLVGENLNYREITRLDHIRFLGESVAVAEGVPSPWMLVGQVSLVLLGVFVADAAISVWRRGDRRPALVMGSTLLFYVLGASVQGVLVSWGIVHWPIVISLYFLVIVVAMSFEMRGDVFDAARSAEVLAKSEAMLRQSERRYDQAVDAAGIAAWEWDIVHDEIWTTDRGRELIGFAPGQRIDLKSALAVMHPEDAVGETLIRSVKAGGPYEQECRVLLAGGNVRWLATRGRVEADNGGKPVAVRGVVFDVTERKWAQERFERLVECVPVGILMVNSSDRIVLVNKQIEVDFGYSRLELVGQPVQLLVGQPLAAEHQFHVESFLAAPSARSMANRVVLGRRKDGADISVVECLWGVQGLIQAG